MSEIENQNDPYKEGTVDDLINDIQILQTKKMANLRLYLPKLNER